MGCGKEKMLGGGGVCLTLRFKTAITSRLPKYSVLSTLPYQLLVLFLPFFNFFCWWCVCFEMGDFFFMLLMSSVFVKIQVTSCLPFPCVRL